MKFVCNSLRYGSKLFCNNGVCIDFIFKNIQPVVRCFHTTIDLIFQEVFVFTSHEVENAYAIHQVENAYAIHQFIM